MLVRDTARSYGTEKTSPSVKTLDEVKNELDRLSRNYQQASADRKRIGAQYEQPVDMDSWGMRKMAESSWLKTSATEGMSGTGKTLADTAIDIGQGAALLPLMAGGAGIYTAGVAANAAAEDMYEQTAKGRSASAALSSGAMTAGMEVAGSEFGDIKGADTKITVKRFITHLEVGMSPRFKILGDSFVKKQVLSLRVKERCISWTILQIKLSKSQRRIYADSICPKRDFA